MEENESIIQDIIEDDDVSPLADVLGTTEEVEEVEELSEAEQIRVTLRSVLKTDEAVDIDNLPEPLIKFESQRAIYQDEVSERFVPCSLDGAYIPNDLYLNDTFFEEYLNQLAKLPLSAETYIKILFSDLYQVLQPNALSITISFHDLGMSIKSLKLSSEDMETGEEYNPQVPGPQPTSSYADTAENEEETNVEEKATNEDDNLEIVPNVSFNGGPDFSNVPKTSEDAEEY